MLKIPRVKPFVFGCVLLILSFLLVEGTLHLFYRAIQRKSFPLEGYRSAIARIAAGEDVKGSIDLPGGEIQFGGAYEVIHPYFGFVRDPSKMPDTSPLGFPGKGDDPFLDPPDDVVTVAVLGGSFAQGVSTSGREALRRALAARGVNARVLTLAIGGYKQPQQLAVLTWLLSRDARIDVVVNIDGFNEVALPGPENVPNGVNPFYPRAWHLRTEGVYDRPTVRLISRGATLAAARQEWAARFEKPLPWSIAVNILWRARDLSFERRIAEVNVALMQALEQAKERSTRFTATGPASDIPEDRFYETLAAHWRTCSVLMQTLCRSRGILYLHLLQPNQYYEPGRILTAEERESAFRENHAYRPGVVSGYPCLLREVPNLLSAGVDFRDLTPIFRDIPEPIYIDDCCHPGQRGYDIVAEYVADAVASRLEAQDPPAGH